MPSNDPEYQRTYGKQHYADNKQRYIDQTRARQDRLKQEVWVLKKRPCADCEIEYPPWVMQFDHREGETKVANIGALIRRCNRRLLMDEIAKCDVVCANCHADRTYKRFHATVVFNGST